MKYVKFGIGVIIAQNINAGCGKCGQEDKAVDEVCKYFGIKKENILSARDVADRNDFGEEVRTDKMEEELNKKNSNLIRYEITKGNPKSGKFIKIEFMAEINEIKANPDYVNEITDYAYKDMCHRRTNKDIFTLEGKHYIKK